MKSIGERQSHTGRRLRFLGGLCLGLFSFCACAPEALRDETVDDSILTESDDGDNIEQVGKGENELESEPAEEENPTSTSAIIRVHYDVGFGKSLHIRGRGADLSWDAGHDAEWTEGNIWVYQTVGFTGFLEYKPTIIDEAGVISWAKGPDYRIASGETVDVYPFFYSTQGSTETGSLYSTTYAGERQVDVYLPPSYHEAGAAGRSYPVFFFFDGQNVFDPDAFFGGWGLDRSLDLLYAFAQVESEGEEAVSGWPIQDVVVIAPHNSPDRIYEYTPTNASFGACDAAEETCGGGADAHLAFLLEDVLPALQGDYRLSGEVFGVGGSSLGGLLSLYACWSQPESFSNCAVFSPSLWWNDQALLEEIQSAPMDEGNGRFYVDVGTQEGLYADVLVLDEILGTSFLAQSGSPNEDYLCLVGEGHGHQETAWRARAPFALSFLLRDENRVYNPLQFPSYLHACSLP